jgi:hypothetical protein
MLLPVVQSMKQQAKQQASRTRSTRQGLSMLAAQHQQQQPRSISVLLHGRLLQPAAPWQLLMAHQHFIQLHQHSKQLS